MTEAPEIAKARKALREAEDAWHAASDAAGAAAWKAAKNAGRNEDDVAAWEAAMASSSAAYVEVLAAKHRLAALAPINLRTPL